VSRHEAYAEQRRESGGVRSAGILVDLVGDEGFSIVDKYERLRPWVGACATKAVYCARAVALLMKEVDQVEADGLLIPAGHRVGQHVSGV
jgi:hypothetical protein